MQIIEFAQSGLKSLVKIAKAFGIDWHVVTDGDAGGVWMDIDATGALTGSTVNPAIIGFDIARFARVVDGGDCVDDTAFAWVDAHLN